MFVKDDDYWEAKKESKNEMTKVIKVWSGKEEAIHDAGFANGAEFGFQKGIKARINTTTISDCPIKDEWHYVKDGDLPKGLSKPVLITFHNKFSDKIVIDIARYSLKLNKWWFIHDLQDLEEDVIAWKEIVPPKEE